MSDEIPKRAPRAIASELLTWFDIHGRHNLPWQHPRTPYRVWVAEIMLQQTQVTTVIAYFNAFMARFPSVEALAAADADAVMTYWAGLGYYARARNLHAAARRIVSEHGGTFPHDLEALMALPGIGRSTAGAIVAQAFGVRAPILDGNAKRVLARLAGLTTTPGTAAHDKRLWALAERYTPHARVTEYTQAIMDLGATHCARRRPACSACPLADRCVACLDATQAEIPAPRRQKQRPRRQTMMLIISDDAGRILFEKRPPSGIWGGLWSLPEIEAGADIEGICRDRFGMVVTPGPALAPVEHGFTHFRLTIHARQVQYCATTRIMEGDFAWYARGEWPGLPAPIARLIDTSQLKLGL